jgi:hypothetical protein
MMTVWAWGLLLGLAASALAADTDPNKSIRVVLQVRKWRPRSCGLHGLLLSCRSTSLAGIHLGDSAVLLPDLNSNKGVARTKHVKLKAAACIAAIEHMP